ncbi:hypothetical protein F5148DRAFT_234557 [Russula earlei]|uniref:Uncharacterized protein n=1 Tax=Russula earlei TaxID=71964 RepID=A0ACC0U4G4_9AGAM|nr:hypothetical protein F5148DRAFT_234557 [Russula earlei]
MAYTSWGSASWSTSSADVLCAVGNHVASVVASVAVPNLLSLHIVPPCPPAAVFEVASVEVDVGLAEDAEGMRTEEDLETGVVTFEVAVSFRGGRDDFGSPRGGGYRFVFMRRGTRTSLTMLIGEGEPVWATKAEGSTTAPLRAGMGVRVRVQEDPVVGLVYQVGTVLLAGVQVMVLQAVGLGAMAVDEDTSNERAQEDSTTGTQKGHDTRFFACNGTRRGYVQVGGMIAFPFFLSVSSGCCSVVTLWRFVSIAGRLRVVGCR